MPDNEAPLKRKKRKKKNNFGYLLLFLIVFVSALFCLSYIVKSYTPDVDVTIGNNEALTLSESDMDTEIKTIDERLKWIQMEDELPTVSIRNPKEKQGKNNAEDNDNKKEEKKDNIDKNVKEKTNNNESIFAPRPTKIDLKKENLNFRINPVQTPDEKKNNTIKTVSKVYIGNFDQIEDAIKIQHRISQEETDIIPFIKSLNGVYVVQIGSFNDSEKAYSLSKRMKDKGYNSKIITE